jgi:hypothetical protein
LITEERVQKEPRLSFASRWNEDQVGHAMALYDFFAPSPQQEGCSGEPIKLLTCPLAAAIIFSFASSISSVAASRSPAASRIKAVSGVLPAAREKLFFNLSNSCSVMSFQSDELVPGVLADKDQFVRLEMQRRHIPVLRVLDEKHHQEGDDCRTSIDDELPRIGIMEDWTGGILNNDNHAREDKRQWTPTLLGRPLRRATERRAYD